MISLGEFHSEHLNSLGLFVVYNVSHSHIVNTERCLGIGIYLHIIVESYVKAIYLCFLDIKIAGKYLSVFPVLVGIGMRRRGKEGAYYIRHFFGNCLNDISSERIKSLYLLVAQIIVARIVYLYLISLKRRQRIVSAVAHIGKI